MCDKKSAMGEHLEDRGARFSPRDTKNRDSCCVFGCKSYGLKDTSVRFHMFPPKGKFYTEKKDMFGNIEKIDVRKQWERVLKIAKPEWITKKWTVCSLHFDRSDYFLPGMPAKRRVLQKTAIPKYNLPQRQQSEEEKVVEEKKKKNKKNRETRRMNREKLKESKDHVQDLYKLVMDHQAQQSDDLEDIQCNEEGKPNLSSPFVDAETQTDSGVSGCEPTFVNKDVQTGSINVCHLIKNDKDLSTMTGIENFGILNAIVDILNTVYPIKKSSYDYKSKVILTFMKLKLNLSYSALAVLFTGIKLTQIRNVFLEMLTLLDEVLQYAVVFPSKKKIHKNMPTCCAKARVHVERAN